MSTPGTRLRTARENCGFKSARLAASAHGWIISTYTSHENGIRGYDLNAARLYAKAFGVSAAWLLTGEVPLISHQAGSYHQNFPNTPMLSKIETVDLPLLSYTQLMEYRQGGLFLEDLIRDGAVMSWFPKGQSSSLISIRVEDIWNAPSLNKDDVVVIDLEKKPVYGKRCLALLKGYDDPLIARYLQGHSPQGARDILCFDNPDIADIYLDDTIIIQLYAVVATLTFD